MANYKPIWPNGAKACISITMDNMGEAADINRGVWDPKDPVGSHHSVQTALPKMLSLLADRQITATYFIEAWNCGVYPDTIKDIAAKGHEVGYHAWQHEVWKSLDTETEVGNLDRSVAAVGELGIKYKGFRPPGGLVTERTLDLMRERGLTYLSPAANRCAVVDGIAMTPFRWGDIDAYFYMKALKGIREKHGDPSDVVDAAFLKKRLCKRIDEVLEGGQYASFLFHPFLQTTEERLKAMEDVLDHVKSKGEAVWLAPCGEVAEWILSHPKEFGTDPGWDLSEWKKK